ncbi:ATP-binding protein, partial [Clostridioides difficile]
NNQKRLRDLENGQCLLQDLYGRVGVVQIHPVFEELLHAFDTSCRYNDGLLKELWYNNFKE